MRTGTNIKLKPWFIENHISENKDCLFVFHHAGGGASYYTSLLPYLNQTFNIYLIQLPGREYRIKEKAYDKLEDLLEDLESALLPHLDSTEKGQSTYFCPPCVPLIYPQKKTTIFCLTSSYYLKSLTLVELVQKYRMMKSCWL